MNKGAFRPTVYVFGVTGRNLHKITNNIVVADLQGADAGISGIAGLQSGNQLAALIAKLDQFIKIGRIGNSDKTAVACQKR